LTKVRKRSQCVVCLKNGNPAMMQFLCTKATCTNIPSAFMQCWCSQARLRNVHVYGTNSQT